MSTAAHATCMRLTVAAEWLYMKGPYIEIGASDWDHEQWLDSYYPEDLPEDWRLGFYQHMFRFVEVPMSRWLPAGSDDTKEWLEGLQDFHFLLAIDAADWQAENCAQINKVIETLGQTVSGCVVHCSTADQFTDILEQCSLPVRIYADCDDAGSQLAAEQICWRPGRETTGSELGYITPAETSDLRTLRSWMDLFRQQHSNAQTISLIFEGDPPSIQVMQDARTIADLLA